MEALKSLVGPHRLTIDGKIMMYELMNRKIPRYIVAFYLEKGVHYHKLSMNGSVDTNGLGDKNQKNGEGYEFGEYTPKIYSRKEYERYFERQPVNYHFTQQGHSELGKVIRQRIPPEEILRSLEKGLHYSTSKKGRTKIPKDRFWTVGF